VSAPVSMVGSLANGVNADVTMPLPLVGSDDAWMNGKDSDLGILCVDVLSELDHGELAGGVRAITWHNKGSAEADNVDDGALSAEGLDEVVNHEVSSLDVDFLYGIKSRVKFKKIKDMNLRNLANTPRAQLHQPVRRPWYQRY
jgi:hypothetical protein